MHQSMPIHQSTHTQPRVYIHFNPWLPPTCLRHLESDLASSSGRLCYRYLSQHFAPNACSTWTNRCGQRKGCILYTSAYLYYTSVSCTKFACIFILCPHFPPLPPRILFHFFFHFSLIFFSLHPF
jgi:hypothetical protein